MKKSLLLPLCGLSFAAAAQVPAAESADDRWTVGIAAGVRDSSYAGEGSRTGVLPLLGYQGERVFWQAASGGVHLYRGRAFSVDAVLNVRIDGFDADDLGVSELRANGIDRALLSDRDDGLDAGLQATWRMGDGSLRLRVLADVSGASEGQEVELGYSHRWQLGQTDFIPSMGVRWQSSDMVNYYYGILDEEIARGVSEYRTGSATIPSVGLTVSRPVGEEWRLLGSVEYRWLPDELSDSPLLEADRSGSGHMLIGISRNF